MPSNPLRSDPAGELRPALALARLDGLAVLSAQVDALRERASRSPRRAADPAWWAAALDRPGAELDAGWARRAGPPVCRARAARLLGRPGVTVTRITHDPSRPGAPLLAEAATSALPRPGAGRSRRGTLPLTGGAGALLPLALPGVLGAGLSRVLATAGPGPVLVLAGLVLLTGAGAALRWRAVRAARAAELARRVRVAVLAAAERELARRALEAERSAAVTPDVRRSPARGGRVRGRAA